VPSEKAARLGCTMIELDVHIDARRGTGVHHDDRLGRCTDARARFPVGASDLLSDYELLNCSSSMPGAGMCSRSSQCPGTDRLSSGTLTPEEQERYLSSAEIALYRGGHSADPHSCGSA